MFNYKVTPESTTIKFPAKLICRRKLKSQLNLLHPDLQGKIESKVKKQKEAHDREEDIVFTRNYRTSPKWIEKTVRVIRSSILYAKLKNEVKLT